MIKVICDHCGTNIKSKQGRIMFIKHCKIEKAVIPLELAEDEEQTPNLHLCDECFSNILEKLGLEEK